jgi:hypothetical protein
MVSARWPATRRSASCWLSSWSCWWRAARHASRASSARVSGRGVAGALVAVRLVQIWYQVGEQAVVVLCGVC